MLYYYRISDNSYHKEKLPGIDKLDCFKNFIDVFGSENLKIVADNVNDKTKDFIKNYDVQYTSLGNAQSLKYAIDQAINTEEDFIYFAEDDYLYLPNAKDLILDGFLNKSIDYISLYDHPDKYSESYSFGETSKVYRTNKSHWRETQSTCMTFAARKSALKRDIDIWHQYTSDTHPHDHQIFSDILKKREPYGDGKLVCAIPGVCHHTDLTESIKLRKIQLEPWCIEMACHSLLDKMPSLHKFYNDNTWNSLKIMFAVYQSSQQAF